LKSEAAPGLHKIFTPGLDLGPEENCKILPESTPSLWIHGHLYNLTCTAITLYTQSKKTFTNYYALLFFLLLMLFRSVCHQVANQTNR